MGRRVRFGFRIRFDVSVLFWIRFGISCLDWLTVSIRWIFRVSSNVRFWIEGSFVVSPCWTISLIAPKRELVYFLKYCFYF